MNYKFDLEIEPMIPHIPALDLQDIDAAREMLSQMAEAEPPFKLPDGVSLDRETIPGGDGNPDIPVLIFFPKDGEQHAGMLYIHGGGFVLGKAEEDKDLPAAIALEAGAVVVSVDYRLAPEHPFPAGLHDAYTALKWLVANADRLNVDSARIAIGGVSAGAGIAAGIALLARDKGGPDLCFQMLDIPVLDDTLETHSMRTFIDTPLWNRPNGIVSWQSYLRGNEGEVSPYAAPCRATDLSGLPPAYVSVSEFDPLRDEGIHYAQRLMQAGVPTELHAFPGTFHGSGGMPIAAVTRRMRAELLDATRRGLAAAQKLVDA